MKKGNFYILCLDTKTKEKYKKLVDGYIGEFYSSNGTSIKVGISKFYKSWNATDIDSGMSITQYYNKKSQVIEAITEELIDKVLELKSYGYWGIPNNIEEREV